MKELKPTVSDLIAMNALYRPDHCLYPEFCKEKMGKRRLFMTLRPVKNY
jgi:DNA polymerase III alpha subunit